MAANLHTLRVALIEPSATQANAIQTRLKEAGVGFVERYTDATQALVAMRADPPDIAISAMHLGTMTGADLAVAIRNDDALKGVAFILVTSIDDAKQLDLVRQAGACAILPKPFTAEELRLALTNAQDFLDIGRLDLEDIEHLRVLIVDDSRSARVFLRHALEAMGVSIITEAENGARGLAALDATQVDLVFTDYNMPEMDGLTFLRTLRGKSWQRDVPVVLISSESHPDRLADIRAAGVSGLLGKPFELAALKALVEGILNRSGA